MPRPNDLQEHAEALDEAHAQAARDADAAAEAVEWAESLYRHRATAGSRYARFMLWLAYRILRVQETSETEARNAARTTYDLPRRRD